MPTTFSFHPNLLDRLARLALATDTIVQASSLRHISLRITPTQIRWSATNGRILVALVAAIEDLDGESGELIFDGEQLTAAAKALLKSPARGAVQVTIHGHEARLSLGDTSMLVRLHPGTFPGVDHVWTRPAEKSWVPCVSTLDHHLVSIAQKIVGKSTVLWRSPTAPGAMLHRLWQPNGDGAVALTDLHALVNAPAYWADHELAVLVMPITRPGEAASLDLTPFAVVTHQPALVAA